jgi:hypothetical protein
MADSALNFKSGRSLGLLRGAISASTVRLKRLTNWMLGFACRWSLSPGEIRVALDSAWSRGAASGKRNAPRKWSWFYEVLRNRSERGYAARLPELPLDCGRLRAPNRRRSSAEWRQSTYPTQRRCLVESAQCRRCGGGILWMRMASRARVRSYEVSMAEFLATRHRERGTAWRRFSKSTAGV